MDDSSDTQVNGEQESVATRAVLKLTAWATFLVGCSVVWRFYIVSGFYGVFGISIEEIGVTYQSARFITFLVALLASLAMLGGAAWLAGAILNFGAERFTDLVVHRLCGFWPSREARWTAGALLFFLCTLAIGLLFELLSIDPLAAPPALLCGWLLGFGVTSWRISKGAGPVAMLWWQRLTSLRTIVATSVLVAVLAVMAHYAAIDSAMTWRYDFGKASERHQKSPFTLGLGYLAAYDSIARDPFEFVRVQPVGDDYAQLCSAEKPSSAIWVRAGSADGQIVLVRYPDESVENVLKIGAGEKVVLPERFYVAINVNNPAAANLICT